MNRSSVDDAPPDAARIEEILAREGVDHVVIGGFAVIAHGYQRLTGDLDIVVPDDRRNNARLARALEALVPGLELPAGRPASELEGLDFGMFLRFQTEHGNLDVARSVAGAPGGYEQLLPGSIEADVGGMKVRIAGLDDLIRMKRAAGRDIDLNDIAALAEAERRRQS